MIAIITIRRRRRGRRRRGMRRRRRRKRRRRGRERRRRRRRRRKEKRKKGNNKKKKKPSEIVAAHDQASQIKYHAPNVLQIESVCWLCQQFDETVEHIVSACPILAKEQYLKRHDEVCAQLCFNICNETGVKVDN